MVKVKKISKKLEKELTTLSHEAHAHKRKGKLPVVKSLESLHERVAHARMQVKLGQTRSLEEVAREFGIKLK